MERRERLKKIIAQREGEVEIDLPSLAGQSVVQEVEVQREIFYTEGSDELKAARVELAHFSLRRAKQRITGAKRRVADMELRNVRARACACACSGCRTALPSPHLQACWSTLQGAAARMRLRQLHPTPPCVPCMHGPMLLLSCPPYLLFLPPSFLPPSLPPCVHACVLQRFTGLHSDALSLASKLNLHCSELGGERPLSGCAFAPNGQQLATCSECVSACVLGPGPAHTAASRHTCWL